jgi:hypothetical protein
MESLLSTSLPIFLGLSLLTGLAAFLTGQALAGNWRPLWQVCGYCVLLALGWRFLSYAMFGAELLSLPGFIADLAVTLAVGVVAYRLTHVSKMVTQYPWLYQRRGLWNYEQRSSSP